MSLRDTSTTREFGCPKKANFNVISIYKKGNNFNGMYLLSNEALCTLSCPRSGVITPLHKGIL